MFQLDSDIYSKQRSVSDYMRENEAYDLNKRAKQQQIDAGDFEMKQKKIQGALQLLDMAIDEPSYQQARQQAQAMGFDTSALPQQYDPMWVESNKRLLRQSQGVQGGETERLIDRYMKETGTSYQEAFDAVKGRGSMTPYQEENLKLKRQEMDQKTKPKPLPSTVVKEQNNMLAELGLANAIEADLGAFRDQIWTGKLNLGLKENFKSGVKNTLGMSDANSRNFQSFRAQLEKMRNDSLRLNKGVQTEGDAQRAWDELIANINDEEVVVQRLDEIARINQRAADLKKLQIDQMRSNFGAEGLDYEPYQMKPYANPQGQPPQSDPRVQKALDAGYSMEEIQQFLGGQ